MLDRPAEIAGTTVAPTREPPPPTLALPARENLGGFLNAVRQRRAILILTVVLVPLCTCLTLRRITPLYTATGSVIYDPSEYKPRQLQSILREDPTTESMMASQAEILQSLHIAEQVAKRGNLFDNPEFNVTLRRHGLIQRTVTAIGTAIAA